MPTNDTRRNSSRTVGSEMCTSITGPLIDGDNWPTIFLSHPSDREEYRPPEGADLEAWLVDHYLLAPADAPSPPTLATFQARSAVHGGVQGARVVFLADRPGLCAEIEAHPCTFATADGAMLTLSTDASASGSYPVPASAGAYFVVYAARQAVASSGEATGGSVTIAAPAQDGSMAGSYALTFAADSAAGDFTAGACPALDALLQSPSSCSAVGGPTSYSELCTCQDQATARSCTRPSGGATWTCTCTASSGAQTTCTAPDAQGEPATDCCPFGFQ